MDLFPSDGDDGESEVQEAVLTSNKPTDVQYCSNDEVAPKATGTYIAIYEVCSYDVQS